MRLLYFFQTAISASRKISFSHAKGEIGLKILFIGDIVGTPGVDYTVELLDKLITDREPDLVIANGENAAAGRGITPKIAERLYDAGVEFLTMGNHTWDKREVIPLLERDRRIIRPINYPPGTPGTGYTVCRANGQEVLIVNVMGRTFMNTLDCPFRAMEDVLEKHPDIRHVLVDVHAETTSEKLAMGWFLAGRVSAVLGTHTHVPTADERILPGGTAYITDVGMVGPRDGILGMDRTAVINKFTTQLPQRFEVASGLRQFCAVFIDLDDQSGRAVAIERILRYE